jgi:hypothetical protein
VLLTQVARTGSLTDVAGHRLYARASLTSLSIIRTLYTDARSTRASSHSIVQLSIGLYS